MNLLYFLCFDTHFLLSFTLLFFKWKNPKFFEGVAGSASPAVAVPCFCCGALWAAAAAQAVPSLGAEGTLSLPGASQAAVLAKSEPCKSEIGLVKHSHLGFQHSLYFYGSFGIFFSLIYYYWLLFFILFSHSFCYSSKCLFLLFAEILSRQINLCSC